MDLPDPSALLLYLDGHDICAALPITSGGWHILRFPLHESGLSRALNLLRARRVEFPTTTTTTSPSPLQLTARNIIRGMR